MMMVSAREAAVILALGEPPLAREQTRRLLASGLAGPATRTTGSVLYDAARVRELAHWPLVDEDPLHAVSPWGFFLARIGPARGLDVTASRADQIAAVERDWDVSPWRALWLMEAAREQGRVPFVATVSGFVALTADLVGLRRDDAPGSEAGRRSPRGRHDTRLLLSEPGAWAETVEGRRLPSGPGGPWQLRVRRPRAGPRRR